jgi:hypothetical protein
MKLSCERPCELTAVVLSNYTLAEQLGRGAAFAGGFGDQPVSRGTGAGEKVTEGGPRLKQRAEPLSGHRLEMPHEFEHAQFAPLLFPQRGAQGGRGQR